MITPKTLDPTTNPTLDDELVITHTNGISERVALRYVSKGMNVGSVSRFTTMAVAQAALAITEGNDGYIPDNSLVIVDELTSYVMGENQE